MVKQLTSKGNGFPFWVLPIFAGILATLGILISYHLAVNEGHVKPFPNTDITHCAIYYPEYIVFRSTLIVSSVLIGITFIVFAWWLQLQAEQSGVLPSGLNWISYGGCIAGYLLCQSTASISDGNDMNMHVHIIGASGFFIVIVIVLGIVTENYIRIYKVNKSFISKGSYKFKMLLSLIILVFALIFVGDQIYSSWPSWVGKAVEWVLTLLVLLYVGSLGLDMKKIGITLQSNQEEGYQYQTEKQYQELKEQSKGNID